MQLLEQTKYEVYEVCDECNDEIYSGMKLVSNNRAFHYCSQDCLRSYLAKHNLKAEDTSEFRKCSVCNCSMSSGYVIQDGEDYYCTDDCLTKVMSFEEYTDMYSNDDAYWTQW